MASISWLAGPRPRSTSPGSSRALRFWSRAIFGVSLALSSACSSCGETKPQGSDAAVVDLSPVPEPAGLVGELVIAKPGDTWTKMRDLGGGPARLMPAGFGMLATTLLGMGAGNADSIDTDIPITGAIAENGEDLALALALHVKSGAELVARLTKGSDSAYDAKPDAATSITLLSPKAGKASGDVALGILGNHLLVSNDAEWLKKLGPYAARTIAKKPPPKEAVVVTLKKQALTGPIQKRLVGWWKAQKAKLERADQDNRQKHGRGTPDFGDPAAAISGLDSTVTGLIGLVGTSAGARVIVEPGTERLDARVEVDAEKTGALAEMLAGFNVGGADEILALPNDVALAILARTTAASREKTAKSTSEGVADLFKDRLTDADKKAIESTLGDLAKGRGDWETYGVVLKEGKGGLLYRAGVNDWKALDAGAKGLVKLLSLRAFAEPLHQFVGDLTVKQSTADITGVPGKTNRALLSLKPSPMPKKADPSIAVPGGARAIEILWTNLGDKAFGALSFEAAPVLVEAIAVETDKSKTHAADAKLAAAAQRVGKEAAFVILVQPNRLGVAGMASLQGAAPVFLSVGRTGSMGWVKLDADRGATEALVKNLVLNR